MKGLGEAHGGGELLEMRKAGSELFEAPAGRGYTRNIPLLEMPI
jgi:hypothetical protein